MNKLASRSRRLYIVSPNLFVYRVSVTLDTLVVYAYSEAIFYAAGK